MACARPQWVLETHAIRVVGCLALVGDEQQKQLGKVTSRGARAWQGSGSIIGRARARQVSFPFSVISPSAIWYYRILKVKRAITIAVAGRLR